MIIGLIWAAKISISTTHYCYNPNNTNLCPDSYKDIHTLEEIEGSAYSIALFLLPKTNGDLLNIDFNNTFQFDTVFITGNEQSLLTFSNPSEMNLFLENLTFRISENAKIRNLYLVNCNIYHGTLGNNKVKNIISDTVSIRDSDIICETAIIEGGFIRKIKANIITSKVNITLSKTICTITLDSNIIITDSESSIAIYGAESVSDSITLVDSDVSIKVLSKIQSQDLYIKLRNCSSHIYQVGYINGISIVLYDSVINTRSGIDSKIFLSLNSSALLMDKYLKIDSISLYGNCSLTTTSDAVLDTKMFSADTLYLKSNNPTKIISRDFVIYEYFKGENMSISNVHRLENNGKLYVPISLFKYEITINFYCTRPLILFDILELDQLNCQMTSSQNDTPEMYDTIVGKEIEIIRSSALIGRIDIIRLVKNADVIKFGDLDFYQIYIRDNSIFYKLLFNPFYRHLKACYACNWDDLYTMINITDKDIKKYITIETLSVTITFREELIVPFIIPEFLYHILDYTLESEYPIKCDPSNINSAINQLTINAPIVFTKPYDFEIHSLHVLDNTTFPEGTTLGNCTYIIVRFEEVLKVMKLGYHPNIIQLMDERKVLLYDNEVVIDNISFNLSFSDLKIILYERDTEIVNHQDNDKKSDGYLYLVSSNTISKVLFTNFTSNDRTIDLELKREIVISTDGDYFPASLKTNSLDTFYINIYCNITKPQVLYGSSIYIYSHTDNTFIDNLTIINALNFYSPNIDYNNLYIDGKFVSINFIKASKIIVRAKSIIFMNSIMKNTKAVIVINDETVPNILLSDSTMFESLEVIIDPKVKIAIGIHCLIASTTDPIGFIPVTCPSTLNGMSYRIEVSIFQLNLIVAEIATPELTPQAVLKNNSLEVKITTILVSIPIACIVFTTIFFFYRKAKKLFCVNNETLLESLNSDSEFQY